MDWLKKLFKKQPRIPKGQAETTENPEKIAATARGESWVNVLNLDIDTDNPKEGAFELDWNEHFIAKLYRAGYYKEGDTDVDMVERWFNDVCRNVVLESYEAEMADPAKRGPKVQRTERDDGKTEYK